MSGLLDRKANAGIAGKWGHVLEDADILKHVVMQPCEHEWSCGCTLLDSSRLLVHDETSSAIYCVDALQDVKQRIILDLAKPSGTLLKLEANSLCFVSVGKIAWTIQ